MNTCDHYNYVKTKAYAESLKETCVVIMIILKEDAMSSLQLSLLLFSVTVRYQTSSIYLHPVSQKLAHSQHKPTNKAEYSIFHIYFLTNYRLD